MKTAMTELIELINENDKYDAPIEGFDIVIKAIKLLEKEKEQIINAHLEGWSDAYDYLKSDSNDQARQAEDYYNQTYNN
jgi:hypothetical protein